MYGHNGNKNEQDTAKISDAQFLEAFLKKKKIGKKAVRRPTLHTGKSPPPNIRCEKKFLKYLFIWLCWVLVAVCRVFVVS